MLQEICRYHTNWLGGQPLTLEIRVRVPLPVQNARLEELVNSPLFQGGDYGFEAHTEYNKYGEIC